MSAPSPDGNRPPIREVSRPISGDPESDQDRYRQHGCACLNRAVSFGADQDEWQEHDETADAA
jgi:hypothetical protein